MSIDVLLRENSELKEQLEKRDAKFAERDTKYAERDATIEAQRIQIKNQRAENKQLKTDLALLTAQVKRLLANTRGNPLLADGQLTLFGGKPTEEPAAEPTPEPEHEHLDEAPDGETPNDSIKRRNKPKRPARKLDMSALAREKVTHELPEDERVCPVTGVALVPVGTKVTEELEYRAAELRVIEHHQVEYGPTAEIAKERKINPFLAPLPPSPLEGCKAGPKLLAQIIVQKYMQHRVPRTRAQHPNGWRSVWCCTEDEGRPLGIGVPASVSNHLELRGSRARVGSVVGKGVA